MNKLIKDGRVAVIFTCDFGGGWSSWCPEKRDICMDGDIAQLVLDSAPVEKIEKLVEKKYPELYLYGLNNLAVAWIKEGTEFIIEEYDGRESIVTREDVEKWHWMKA